MRIFKWSPAIHSRPASGAASLAQISHQFFFLPPQLLGGEESDSGPTIFSIKHPHTSRRLDFFSFLLHVDNTSVCLPLPFPPHSPAQQRANNHRRRIISIVFDLLLVP